MSHSVQQVYLLCSVTILLIYVDIVNFNKLLYLHILIWCFRPKVERARPALYDMLFLLTGFKPKQRSTLAKEITKLGGKAIREFADGKPMAVIATPTQMENIDKNYHIQQAKNLDIQVVSEDFVTEAKDNVGKIPELIIKKNMSNWGSDVS